MPENFFLFAKKGKKEQTCKRKNDVPGERSTAELVEPLLRWPSWLEKNYSLKCQVLGPMIEARTRFVIKLPNDLFCLASLVSVYQSEIRQTLDVARESNDEARAYCWCLLLEFVNRNGWEERCAAGSWSLLSITRFSAKATRWRKFMIEGNKVKTKFCKLRCFWAPKEEREIAQDVRS